MIIGFIGLGIIGLGNMAMLMLERLCVAGQQVLFYARSFEAIDAGLLAMNNAPEKIEL